MLEVLDVLQELDEILEHMVQSDKNLQMVVLLLMPKLQS
jgi:hypothetical protein